MAWVHILAPPLAIHETLYKLLNLSVLQFPRLQSGDDNSTYFIGREDSIRYSI